MYVYACENQRVYLDLVRGPIFRDRYELERRLATSHRDQSSFEFSGVCLSCQQAVDFRVDREWGARLIDGIWLPNWRERQVCPTCQLNSRQRAAVTFIATVIQAAAPRPLTIYMTEQITPLYRRCRELFPDVTIIGSEYLGPELASGATVRGLRHEDIQSLSLPSESVDLVVTNDVVEHVPDVGRGFRELHRILRPGGQLFLTTPFNGLEEVNVVRAELVDGAVVHRLPAAYHGNPLLPNGSLVFTDFGWEILAQMGRACLQRPMANVFWSYVYGHLGIPQEFFHAVK